MQYKVVGVRVNLGTDVFYATNKLDEIVKRKIMLGWEPQGGVSCTVVVHDVYIMQAMILREKNDK